MKVWPDLIRNAATSLDSDGADHVFLGIDECLKRNEIFRLASDLTENNMIRSSAPLWWERRTRLDGSELYAYGGISKDNASQITLLDGDLGKPVKYSSYDDSMIIDYLITHFLSYGKLVLLTENTKNNENGLRRLLDKQIHPMLEEFSGGKLALVVLYRTGKTDIQAYCDYVYNFIQTWQWKNTYHVEFI